MDTFIEGIILNREKWVTLFISWNPGWPLLTGFPQVGGILSHSTEINTIWSCHEADVDIIKQQLVNMTKLSLVLCIHLNRVFSLFKLQLQIQTLILSGEGYYPRIEGFKISPKKGVWEVSKLGTCYYQETGNYCGLVEILPLHEE